MEKLANILHDTEKALRQLDRALQEEFSDIIRDATIQRFEYSFELFWKLVKTYLNIIEGIDCYSPKTCFRELLPISIASENEVEMFLKMTDHRNLTTHIYDEGVSDEVFRAIPSYYSTINDVLNRIKIKINEMTESSKIQNM